MVCPSNQYTRRLLRLGICALFLCLVIFSIGVLTGCVLTFRTYESNWDSYSATGTYSNVIQDFLALCPSYICGLSTQGAQHHCDAAETYMAMDDKMWVSTGSNALTSVDTRLREKQASYVIRLRVNVGLGPVEISFGNENSWKLVSATCTHQCWLTGRTLKWYAPPSFFYSKITDVTLTFRDTSIFYEPKAVKTKIFVPLFGLSLRGHVKVESVGFKSKYIVEAYGGSAVVSDSTLVLFRTGPFSRDYGILHFLEPPTVKKVLAVSAK